MGGNESGRSGPKLFRRTVRSRQITCWKNAPTSSKRDSLQSEAKTNGPTVDKNQKKLNSRACITAVTVSRSVRDHRKSSSILDTAWSDKSHNRGECLKTSCSSINPIFKGRLPTSKKSVTGNGKNRREYGRMNFNSPRLLKNLSGSVNLGHESPLAFPEETDHEPDEESHPPDASERRRRRGVEDVKLKFTRVSWGRGYILPGEERLSGHQGITTVSTTRTGKLNCNKYKRNSGTAVYGRGYLLGPQYENLVAESSPVSSPRNSSGEIKASGNRTTVDPVLESTELARECRDRICESFPYVVKAKTGGLSSLPSTQLKKKSYQDSPASATQKELSRSGTPSDKHSTYHISDYEVQPKAPKRDERASLGEYQPYSHRAGSTGRNRSNEACPSSARIPEKKSKTCIPSVSLHLYREYLSRSVCKRCKNRYQTNLGECHLADFSSGQIGAPQPSPAPSNSDRVCPIHLRNYYLWFSNKCIERKTDMKKKKKESKAARHKNAVRKAYCDEALGYVRTAKPYQAVTSFTIDKFGLFKGKITMDGLRFTLESDMLQSFVREEDPMLVEPEIEKLMTNNNEEKKEKKLRKGKKDTRADRVDTPEVPMTSMSFFELSKELKLKAKQQEALAAAVASRKMRRQEECYTDKDRAAAVNMGTRDIKLSLKMKRKQERSKILQIPEETEPGTLIALCNHELRNGHINLAMGFINKALELNPNDKNALVARSKCHLLLGNPQQALEDAEAAINLDKTCTKALFQKAESLYHLGEFELSLMYFHRGLRVRPEMEGFRLGVQKAQEAIENVIGDNKTPFPSSPHVLKSLLGSIVKTPSTTKRQDTLQKRPSKVSEKTQSQMKKNEKLLLGKLHEDKKYLERLLAMPKLITLNQEFANNNIAAVAKEGIDFLNSRQEFWRQRKTNENKNGRKKI